MEVAVVEAAVGEALDVVAAILVQAIELQLDQALVIGVAAILVQAI